jgi:hypothetical protein
MVASLDVTEQYLARERLALLNEASTRIGSTLDVVRTAKELAEVAVPGYADWVSVDLLDAVYHGDEPLPGREAGPVVLRRAAYRSRVPIRSSRPRLAALPPAVPSCTRSPTPRSSAGSRTIPRGPY